MELIADFLMIAGTIAVTIYCMILARRLNRFTDLEKGVGGAIAVLSAQVDDMTKTLMKAQKTAASSAAKLEDLTRRAEEASRRMELLIAATHDLPEPARVPETTDESSTPTPPQNTPEDRQEALFLSQRNRVEAAE